MDDIIVRLLENKDEWGAKCWQCGEVDGHYEGCLMVDAADELKRLRALCNDLYHDATCSKPFCRLCGEGIREWEADRG